MLDGVQHGVVLSCDAHTQATMAALRSDNGSVVGLSATARKHNLARLTTDDIGHHITGFINCLTH
ncbi:unannotated protein [freshwater metagenome]|uniref:Unannotated protein n=1 Tax=freshwater metagenome TaxID=449393 RepID=A0A6J6Y5X9_9ZZZZ